MKLPLWHACSFEVFPENSWFGQSDTWWLCLYSSIVFLPLRSPIRAVTKCNLCFSSVILWDQCLRQHVWQGISGLRKKARCDADLFYYSHLTFLSQSVSECLVFFNCKIQDFCFCPARNSTGATNKVQDRQADYQLFLQTTEEMPAAQRWTEDTYIFCNSQWGMLVHPIHREF